MKTEIRYFVSFVGSGKGVVKNRRVRVYGHGIFTIDNELESVESFEELQNYICEDRKVKDVVILFYKLVKRNE